MGMCWYTASGDAVLVAAMVNFQDFFANKLSLAAYDSYIHERVNSIHCTFPFLA